MTAIILMDVDDAESCAILETENGENLIFESVEAADMWIQDNARNGWCTRIIDLYD